MAAPLIAAKIALNVAIQKAIPFLKKNPWVIPAVSIGLVVTIVAASVFVFGTISGAGNIKLFTKSCESSETFTAEKYPDGVADIGVDEIAAEVKNCDGSGMGAYGLWAIPSIGSISSVYGPRGSKCGANGCSSSFHPAIDFAGNGSCGAPVLSASIGTVIFSANGGGYGNQVIIDHGNNIHAYYNHLASRSVAVGDSVEPGQEIAKMGNTGISTGCHLDWRMKLNGQWTDPIPFFLEQGINLPNLSGVQLDYIRGANPPGYKTLMNYCNTPIGKQFYFCPGGLSREDTPPVPTEPLNPVEADGDIQKWTQSYMSTAFKWNSSQFSCLVKLWNKESNWRPTAQNNAFAPNSAKIPENQAYGIPQAGPGKKMASAGADWKTNPQTQVKWGLGYIKDRYGSPCAAWAHSQKMNWY